MKQGAATEMIAALMSAFLVCGVVLRQSSRKVLKVERCIRKATSSSHFFLPLLM